MLQLKRGNWFSYDNNTAITTGFQSKDVTMVTL